MQSAGIGIKFYEYSIYLTVILRTRVDAPNRLSLIFDESEWNNCFIIYMHAQGLNSQTLLFGYFQYFSIWFMFLSADYFSKIYIFNHFKF
jgi:hypothetical protein